MSKSKIPPQILLDADVVRHFLKASKFLFILPKIFPRQLVILDKVKQELCRSASLMQSVNNFLMQTKIPIIDFPQKREIILEYATLLKTFGSGESACMAVARFQKQYIASSNLKDIAIYCSKHSITYYTTMDLLNEAYKKGLMTEADCDEFIYEVLRSGSILPCTTMNGWWQLCARRN